VLPLRRGDRGAVHRGVKGADALELEVLSGHGLLAAKRKGDVDVLGEAEQLADPDGELLETVAALLDGDPAETDGEKKHGVSETTLSLL